MKLLFCTSLLVLAGCSATLTSDGSSPSGLGTSPEAGASETGSPTTPDADDDSGPEWDGTLFSTPTKVVSRATRFAITRDDQIVFAQDSVGVSAIAASGGTTTSVGTNADVTLLSAGRAALVQSNADGTVTAYTKMATRAIPQFAVEAGAQLYSFDTASGDFALVFSSFGGGWFFDATTLTMTPIDSLPNTTSIACRASGETLACFEATQDASKLVLFTADRQGARVRTTVAGKLALAPFVVDGDVFFSDGSSAFRLAVGAQTPTMLLAGATDLAAVQDGWLAATASDGVHVMKPDGSQAKTIATGAHLEKFTTLDDHDWARIRWVGMCDQDSANLRVYDPATERTVSLSKEGCDLHAITYPDNFAFFIDGAHYVNQPVIQEAGTPTVVDLRDGTSRGNPTGIDFFDHNAIAIGKSRLLFTWLAFGELAYGAYYDGHSPATSAAASFNGATSEFNYYRMLAGDHGTILPVGTSDTSYELFFVPLP